MNSVPTIRDAYKAGYELIYLMPTEIARACALVCGSKIRYLPQFSRPAK